MSAATYQPTTQIADPAVCPSCGREKTPQSLTCEICYGLRQRKVEPTNRDLAIYRAVRAGATLEAAGGAFGLSRERVRQIAKSTAKLLGEEGLMPKQKQFTSPRPIPAANATPRQRATIEVYAARHRMKVSDVMRHLADQLYESMSDQERAEVDRQIQESQD